MPSASLGRDYFPIIRKLPETQDGVKKTTIIGYFSTIKSTTRFFGLQEIAAAVGSILTITRKATAKRSVTRADGTTTSASAADVAAGGSSTAIEAESSQVMIGFSKGSKTVRLKTGKPIADGAKSGNFTVSFRFPSDITNLMISNALGDLLPPANVAAQGATPEPTQVFPYFISSGGKRYPIVAQSAAKADTALVIVPNSAAALSGALPEGDTIEQAE